MLPSEIFSSAPDSAGRSQIRSSVIGDAPQGKWQPFTTRLVIHLLETVELRAIDPKQMLEYRLEHEAYENKWRYILR